jgi:UPF0176 protein
MEMPVVISAFYHFAVLEDYEAMKDPLLQFCNEQGLKGTFLLAHEGINSTISGTREGIDALYQYLRNDPRLKDFSYKESFAEVQPFLKMKVRLKKEIVAMGTPDLDVDTYKGTYVAPQAWDALIADPDVLVVDTRNSYEIAVGTFEGAVNPNTRTFREFPQWAEEHLHDKKQKIAMFCTGGIRCEKSTAYLKRMGFEHVYHLQGGILQYFADTKNAQQKWQGDCFIFDDRAVLNVDLEPNNHLLCPACQATITTDDIKHSPSFEDGLRCSQCRSGNKT